MNNNDCQVFTEEHGAAAFQAPDQVHLILKRNLMNSKFASLLAIAA
jgi:hypothetical protein